MRLEYHGETRWTPLTGAALAAFVRVTGAQIGSGLPEVVWQALPFYDFTALVRLPDVMGGKSEYYFTKGGRFWSVDAFGVAIAALNETARLRLTSDTVAAYFRFYCAFTQKPMRTIVLDVKDPELAAEVTDETDPLLRGVVVEGHDPQGWLLTATVLCNKEVQRRAFRITPQGEVVMLESLAALTAWRKAS